MRHKQGRNISSATVICRMSKAHHTTKPKEKMQASCEQGEDQDVYRQDLGKGRAVEWQQSESGKADRDNDAYA